MALMQTVIAGAGPLPVVNNFNAEGDGDVLFFVSGSAWSETAGTPISIALFVDNQQIGTISGYTNESKSHKTLVSAFFPFPLTQGQHVVELVASFDNVTITDENDNFNVMVIY